MYILIKTVIFVEKDNYMVGLRGRSGGKREGAGKPKGLNQKAISVRIDLDLYEYVSSKTNKNRFINDCIREHYNSENKNE